MQVHPLSMKPKSLLEEKAYQILRQLDIYEPKQIDLDFIASIHQIEIIYCNSKSHTVIHPYRSNWYQIIINKSLNEQVQREKIAHELGHLLIHIGNQFLMPSDFIQMQERQTYNFTGYLLVPFFMFKDFEIPYFPDEAVHFISEKFNVTLTLANQKYKQLMTRQYEHRYSLSYSENLLGI